MNVAAEPASRARGRFGAGAPPGDDSALSAERPFPGLRPFGFADRGVLLRPRAAGFRPLPAGRERAVHRRHRQLRQRQVVSRPRGPDAVCSPRRAPTQAARTGFASTCAPALRRYRASRRRSRASPKRTAPTTRPGAGRIEYRLRQSSFSFESALEEAGGLGGRTLLLIVDQFEELFRFGLAGLGLRRAGNRGDAGARRSDAVRADPARRRPPAAQGRACAHHHALGFHRRLRLFPRAVGGGERDAVSGSEPDAQPARGCDPQADRKGRRRRSSRNWSSG